MKQFGKLILALIGACCIVGASVNASAQDKISGQQVPAGFYSIKLQLTTNSEGRVTKVLIMKSSGNKMVDYYSVKFSYNRRERPSTTVIRQLDYHLK